MVHFICPGCNPGFGINFKSPYFGQLFGQLQKVFKLFGFGYIAHSFDNKVIVIRTMHEFVGSVNINDGAIFTHCFSLTGDEGAIHCFIMQDLHTFPE